MPDRRNHPIVPTYGYERERKAQREPARSAKDEWDIEDKGESDEEIQQRDFC
ncbi:MAG: hypothetical protein IPK68_14015 [Bdellovibrionales bacterium]|nr:hypothetical protein [Bdellovibrionales bacterium]